MTACFFNYVIFKKVVQISRFKQRQLVKRQVAFLNLNRTSSFSPLLDHLADSKIEPLVHPSLYFYVIRLKEFKGVYSSTLNILYERARSGCFHL